MSTITYLALRLCPPSADPIGLRLMIREARIVGAITLLLASFGCAASSERDAGPGSDDEGGKGGRMSATGGKGGSGSGGKGGSGSGGQSAQGGSDVGSGG